MFGQFMKMNTASSSGSGTLPGNTITNPKEELKGITTCSGTAYQGLTIPTTSSLPPVVERETEVTKDTVHPTNNGSTKDVQPPVVQTESPILNSDPAVAPIIEPVVAPKLRDKANDQREKFFQIFKDLNFNISFADALILMPKFSPTIKTLLTNKDKLSELARTPLNEHCLVVLLKKLPENWGTPTGRALIDVFEGELTLCVGKEAITFNLDPTSRYSANYNDMTANRIDKLKRCEDTNLCLNWEKSHFMVKEGIVLGHKISKNGIEVDKAKVNVITKLPHPTTLKGIRSFLGHAGFYRRFIKDFSKIARPMTRLFEKDTPFFFSKECVEAFQTHKRKLTKASILIAPDWDLPFELMCNASDFAIGAVLGKRQKKHFRPIHYASKTMTKAESNYTTTEKEMLAVVYAFEKFWSYLIMNKSIVYTDHSALKYLFAKKDSKARLLRWVLLLQEFTFKVTDTKGAKNLAGIDSMGPFPSSRGNKYIIVVVDYLSKWVEAKALPTNDAQVVCKFLKNLFARFKTPCAIISDRGTHFCNDQFAKVMLKYGVTHRLDTAYHPQTSGEVEVSNRGLKRILERKVGENRASWSNKQDDALWAF
nr:reverse transcriptase domain-containing protein [Tanacetum cinerariifolium]